MGNGLGRAEEIQKIEAEEGHHDQSCALFSYCQPEDTHPLLCALEGLLIQDQGPKPQLQPRSQSRYVEVHQTPVQTQGQKAKATDFLLCARPWPGTSCS